jgi:hypothetical protein
VVVVAKDLLEPELDVEGQGSAHVPHHEYGLDSIKLLHAQTLETCEILIDKVLSMPPLLGLS